MSDPTDIPAENIATRTMSVKELRKAIYERLMRFDAFGGYSFYNYVGSEDREEIIRGIDELKASQALVLAYESSEYDYEPMADRTFTIYLAVRNVKLYVRDFDVDPLSDAVEAVILALDKWAPGGHCRLRVTHDGTLSTAQAFSVAEVTIKAEDQ